MKQPDFKIGDEIYVINKQSPLMYDKCKIISIDIIVKSDLGIEGDAIYTDISYNTDLGLTVPEQMILSKKELILLKNQLEFVGDDNS